MPSSSLLQYRWSRWVLAAGFWTGLGLFFALQMVVSYAGRGEPLQWTGPLVYQLSVWYMWGLLAPVVVRLARQYRIDRRPWQRGVLVHFPAGILIAGLHVAAAIALRFGGFLLFDLLPSNEIESFLGNVDRMLLTGVFDSFITYWMILAVFYLFDYYRKYREREVRASHLEAQLAQAQLTALKMQLHPHFLFNTLNSISALVSQDAEAAERMIARLSDLLRLTLERGNDQEVSLREELTFLDQYLEIEKVRFQDRLSVEIAVEPDVLDARVPTLLLQPIVENAVRYGIAPRPEPGTLRLAGCSDGDWLVLRVQDDGPGLPTGGRLEEGVGLANTRARLQQLYGRRHRFELRVAPGGGLLVEIAVPLHRKSQPNEVAPEAA